MFDLFLSYQVRHRLVRSNTVSLPLLVLFCFFCLPVLLFLSGCGVSVETGAVTTEVPPSATPTVAEDSDAAAVEIVPSLRVTEPAAAEPTMTEVVMVPETSPTIKVTTTLSATLQATPAFSVEQVSPTDEHTTQPPERPPQPAATVALYEEQITLPTYPLERYQTDAVDPRYNWPYKRFDVERFRAEAPAPEPRSYQLLILENPYLKVLILPELGGRIWQMIHKPTGTPIFYQNSVVKPTHWGIADQLGWLALGGIEWSLPVIEHGYDWGTSWDYRSLQQSSDLATVTLSTPKDGRLLQASIKIALRADSATLEIAPTLTNLADQELTFSYWHAAMLAPGSGKRPTEQLRFILPNETMTVHSTGDPAMPPPAQPFSWPIYNGRDLSRLGNYTQYLGFFEAPAARGPFAAVYDVGYDVGVVRVFPAEITRGSKVFALGWQDALGSHNFTDDDSLYVELHSGLAPTFDDQYQLPAAGRVTWRETWYPVAGIGNISYANAVAALAVTPVDQMLEIALYATQSLAGSLQLVDQNKQLLAAQPYQAHPGGPFIGQLVPDDGIAQVDAVRVIDKNGRLLLTYQLVNSGTPESQ